MKRINKTFVSAALLILVILLSAGCNRILNEQPRSTFTPEYFKTPNGVTGGITSLYASLRNMFGSAYWLDACQVGTDESTWGRIADQNFKDMDYTSVSDLNSQTSRSDVLWNTAFPAINTANGVIQYGAEVGVSNSLIAEARFFRAFYYFYLVQEFGGVPLDLGSGVLKFNTSSARGSLRNTVPEVYTKEIFPDLDSAVNNLPSVGRVTGGVSQTLARLFLSKAYLTYAWWLQNPNNIPTYPAVTSPRTDPDGHDAQWYFQQAYNVATFAIQNPGPFGLQPTFYDVNVATNDRNNEILLYADHTLNTQYGGLTSTVYSTGGAPDNYAGWVTQWNYTGIWSSTTPDWSGSVVNSVQRAAVQNLGRPWTEICPPFNVFDNTFADKTNDSRYDGTFTTVYRCNMNESGLSKKYQVLYGANGLPINQNSAVLTFLNNNTMGVNYSNAVYKSNVGAGVLPGMASFVVEPNHINRDQYPGNWKLGPYRTDNGSGLGQPNAGSTRPYNIAKFSELFFIAAEAAVKGATTTPLTGTYANDGTARGLLSIIRARAGRWEWSHNGDSAMIEDRSAEMVASMPQDITIDYILAERSREYFGEGYRWFDLVRTQTWGEPNFGGTYTIGNGVNFNDHSVSTFTRTITPQDYLRPIPIGQMNGMQLTASQLAAYQNPGYQ